jgi:alpha-D-xyloside xylohydrolase
MLVFSAMTHINCWYIKNPPWFNVNRNENNADIKMVDSEKFTELACYWLKLRRKLFPYLRAAFDKYESDGLPPFRALVLDYESAPEVINISDQYMMGECLLVAPLIAGADCRRVYLPDGKWKNMFTGEILETGWHEVNCSLEQMPVYANLNSGSMLNLLPELFN